MVEPTTWTPVVNGTPKVVKVILNVWRHALLISIVALSIRYIVAIAQGQIWATLLATSAVAAIAAWLPGPAFFGFAVLVPLLNALARIGVPFAAITPEAFGCSLAIGWYLRWGAFHRSTIGRFTLGNLAIDLFISLVLLSLARLLVHEWSSQTSIAFWNQPAFGFGTPLFGLSSALTVLLGYLVFRVLDAHSPELRLSAADVEMVFAGYAITTAIGVAFQWISGIPDLYGTHIAVSQRAWIPTLPGNDIHTLGSLAVMIAAFSLTRVFRRDRIDPKWIVFAIIGVAVAIVCWSRAAWLSLGVVCLVLTWRCGRKKIVAGLLVITLVSILTVGLIPRNWIPTSNPYVDRLFGLVDVVHWSSSNSDRLELYQRAVRIIIRHPLDGIGIGNYYRLSPAYSSLGSAAEMKFAHDTFLQFAAEIGIPAALCFACFVFVVFRVRSEPDPQNILFGMKLAFCAVMVTQLTSNAVNIFTDQNIVLMFCGALVVLYRPSSNLARGT